MSNKSDASWLSDLPTDRQLRVSESSTGGPNRARNGTSNFSEVGTSGLAGAGSGSGSPQGPCSATSATSSGKLPSGKLPGIDAGGSYEFEGDETEHVTDFMAEPRYFGARPSTAAADFSVDFDAPHACGRDTYRSARLERRVSLRGARRAARTRRVGEASRRAACCSTAHLHLSVRPTAPTSRAG